MVWSRYARSFVAPRSEASCSTTLRFLSAPADEPPQCIGGRRVEWLHKFTVRALRGCGQPDSGCRCRLPDGKPWEVRHGAIGRVRAHCTTGGAARPAIARRRFLRVAPYGILLRLFAGFSGAPGEPRTVAVGSRRAAPVATVWRASDRPGDEIGESFRRQHGQASSSQL